MDDSQPTSASEPPVAVPTRAPRAEPPQRADPAAPADGTQPTTTSTTVGPRDAADPAPRALAGSPRSTDAARVFGWGSPEDTWDAEETLLSWKLIGGILAVLLLVGFGAYKVFGNSKPTDAAKPDNVNAAPADPDPNAPVSAEKDITDAFTGTSAAGLGTADTGQLWETPTGTWGKADGHAYLVDPNKEGGNRSMAVIDLKSGNGSVTVTAAKMTPSWGLVFRYKGPFNYWMLVASPKFGTYNLVKVEDGKATSVGNSGLTKQDAGTVVGVTFQGDQVAIVVDGVQAAAFTDGAFATATKVGLVAADQTAKDAQWSAFSAKTLAGKAPPGAKKAPTTTAAKQAGP